MNYWRDLKSDPIPQELIDAMTCVLLFNSKLNAEKDFPGYPYSTSNPVYASSGNALEAGYTHWLEFNKFKSPT